MTRTIKAQRQRRYRMAQAYLRRRAYPGATALFDMAAYNAWVDAFPKFMNIAYPGKLSEAALRRSHK